MSDTERLDEAIQRLKCQMAKDDPKVKEDWKKAYLNGIAYHRQSLNKTEGIECQN